MASSNFSFLEREFPILFNIASSAEYNLYSDPAISLIKLRSFLEKITDFIFETHDFEKPYDNSLHNRIRIIEDEGVLPLNISSLAHNIRHRGNAAAHEMKGTVEDAKTILFSAFKFGKWFYETYSEQNEDISALKFSLPKDLDARHALSELEKNYSELEKRFNDLLAAKEKQILAPGEKEEIRTRAEKSAKKIDLDEAETRELIDSQLRTAGWDVDSGILNYKLHKTLPQKGRNMAIAEWPAGEKWADYALFVGMELYGIVEAKRYAQDISTDLRQSKIYAERVEEKSNMKLVGKWKTYSVPFLFSTNGRPYLEQIKTKSGIWFLDVRNIENTARPLQAKISCHKIFRRRMRSF
jgi:type I restriction enzyme, R subunit